jgi:subtilisin family serine protease
MTRKTWVLMTASVLVSSILLEGQVFAAGERKKIVMASNSSDFEQLLGVLLEDALKNPLNGIHVVYTLSMLNAVAIELSPYKTVQEGLAYLQNLIVQIPSVVYDDLMFSVLPITPALPGQVPLQEACDWGLVRIGVDVAHREMPQWKGQGVKVAVVDTGIDCGHPDLPLVFAGVKAVPEPDEVSYCDYHGHGTHVAGIIAARENNAGIIGVAPGASLVAVKVLNKNGKGYLSYLLFGLQWIWHYNNLNPNKIQLVNMSLGFSVGSPLLKAAVEKLSYDHNTIMVAAAGNSCPSPGGQEEAGGDEGQGACNAPGVTTLYPAAYSVVLAVTAINDKDQIAYYSLTGPAIDVIAPGGERKGKRILSTYLGGLYGLASGTSPAAAHVTGALALKLQQQALSLGDVQLLLAHTATNLKYPATQQGWGLIDVECLLKPTLPQCPPR